jgi:5-methyltetrahydrofolate--homocysteine methyltransferase
LITPSLDEMVYLAKEMDRKGIRIPIMIGGATTSKAHTAVKIAPQYKETVIHVNDASRAVTVASSLLGENKKTYTKEIKNDYDLFREKFLNRSKDKNFLTIEQARENKLQLNWKEYTPNKPNFIGTKIVDIELEELIPYIDWNPFFRTWELFGKYPDILHDEIVGEQATSVFNDAKESLEIILKEKKLTPKGIIGIFPANQVNEDDIEVRNLNGDVLCKFLTLRQQTQKTKGAYNIALSDYILPKETGKTDYIGVFCVSCGFGVDEYIEAFEKELDDYNSIMVKALADRLAEAFAEYLHEKVRKEIWGYSPIEDLSNEDLIFEKYKGIRPAPGYPSCPDHLEKLTIWDLLNVEQEIGVTLTESMAMWPASSVSGYYFGNPESKYFGLGRIKDDQVIDYAKRRNISTDLAKKWLNPNITD